MSTPVCTRCQHRTCVCKPRERMLRESEVVAAVRNLQADLGRDDTAYCALEAVLDELGIELNKTVDK